MKRPVKKVAATRSTHTRVKNTPGCHVTCNGFTLHTENEHESHGNTKVGYDSESRVFGFKAK